MVVVAVVTRMYLGFNTMYLGYLGMLTTTLLNGGIISSSVITHHTHVAWGRICSVRILYTLVSYCVHYRW